LLPTASPIALQELCATLPPPAAKRKLESRQLYDQTTEREIMKNIIRVAVVAVLFTTAGCISNADVAQVSAAAPSEPAISVFGEMHAAIPAGKTDKSFEYN